VPVAGLARNGCKLPGACEKSIWRGVRGVALCGGPLIERRAAKKSALFWLAALWRAAGCGLKEKSFKLG